MNAVHLRLTGVAGNGYGARHAGESAGKGFRDHEGIPGAQYPGVFDGDMKSAYWNPSGPGQQHRAGLGHVARPTRAINGESHIPTLLQFAAHVQEGSGCATTARAAHRDKAELADD